MQCFDLPYTVHEYILTSYISRGAYGSVYKATSTKYQMEFAIKVISLDKESRLSSCFAEIESLKQLDEPHVIKIYDSFIEDNSFYMVLELCKQSLLDVINEKEYLNEKDIQIFCRQIFSAISECHKHSIAHRDIKPNNILLDEFNRVKVADFGLSAFINHGDLMTNFIGTDAYLAPEIQMHRGFDPYAADIWALGVLIYQMTTGELPWVTESYKDMINCIKCGYIQPNHMIPNELYQIILRMLDSNPKNRITIDELLELPYFKNGIKSTKTLPTLASNSMKNIHCIIVRPGKKIIPIRPRKLSIGHSVPPAPNVLLRTSSGKC